MPVLRRMRKSLVPDLCPASTAGCIKQGVDSRDKPGHDEERECAYSSGRPVSAASSRSSRGEIWPVTGSLRSRSNFWIAAIVSAPYVAGRLHGAIAEVVERALHRDHARRRRDQVGDRIGPRGSAAARRPPDLSGARAIARSTSSVGSPVALSFADVSKSRIAASVFGPSTPSTGPS